MRACPSHVDRGRQRCAKPEPSVVVGFTKDQDKIDASTLRAGQSLFNQSPADSLVLESRHHRHRR